MREPFNQSREDIKKLDPVSAKLLFFRDPRVDEFFATEDNEPPTLRAFTRFEKKFKGMGYSDEHIGRLWAILEERRQSQGDQLLY